MKGRRQKVPAELLHTIPGLVFQVGPVWSGIDAIYDKHDEPRRVDGSRAGRVEAIERLVGCRIPCFLRLVVCNRSVSASIQLRTCTISDRS